MSIARNMMSGAVPMSVALHFRSAGIATAQSTAPAALEKTTATKKTGVPVATHPVLEPKALAIEKAASDRLAAIHSMSFTPTVSYRSPNRVGVPLAYAAKRFQFFEDFVRIQIR